MKVVEWEEAAVVVGALEAALCATGRIEKSWEISVFRRYSMRNDLVMIRT
jgi:hypothetical protein